MPSWAAAAVKLCASTTRANTAMPASLSMGGHLRHLGNNPVPFRPLHTVIAEVTSRVRLWRVQLAVMRRNYDG
jgi:hypothetical protein